MFTCSIGIMAYNEAANIGSLLEALLNQQVEKCVIQEIIVVASGCEDRTEEIVRNYIKKDARIQLLVQSRREGKASAINLFLSKARGEILLLESGDTLPKKTTVEKMVIPFMNSKAGMTGAHPVPLNSSESFLGYTVHLLWRLHHRVALSHPKLGELVAFRNIVKEIPPDTAVDEASIEAIITRAGYKLQYVPDAIVYNKGTETISEFLNQRRRIAAGHLYVKHSQQYSVSTTSASHIMKPLIQEVRCSGREIVWMPGAVFLEVLARIMGHYDYYVRKRNPFIWDRADSTKKLKGYSG
jgi:cellulose synthase/poly-beta-1,6-N-acetylglucosamine synthase-like glycosyltransferase